MKTIGLLVILITFTACTSYHHRPVQDQVVGGISVLDAFTGRDRVGLIAKQAHYDSFISKAVPTDKWFSHIPILNIFSRPDGYEICRAPPADAMASTASSLAAAISGESSTTADAATLKVAATLAESFANKVKAFSIRTQGLQYIRDVRFDNCVIWQNRGDLGPQKEAVLREKMMTANAAADEIGRELILKELVLRAVTNNFGVSSAEVTKEELTEMERRMNINMEKISNFMDKLDTENKGEVAAPPPPPRNDNGK